MKKIGYGLILIFILFSCSSSINDTKQTEVSQNNIDRNSPENVMNGYALSMKDCDLNNGINYYDPITAKILKDGYKGIINSTLDTMNGFADAIGVKETEKEKFKQGQEKLTGAIEKTGVEEIDYNKICKESKLEISNFKILDKGEILDNNAKFQVSYNFQGKDAKEYWYATKIGKDWFLIDGINNNDNNEKIKSEVSENNETILPNDIVPTSNEYNGISFSVSQIQEIKYGLENKIDPKLYANPEYTPSQMKEIRYGLEAGLDVSSYANPEYTPSQMQEIKYGLENKIDPKLYANPEYTPSQMKEIRYGLEAGLDVSSYAKIEYTPSQMKEKRYSLDK